MPNTNLCPLCGEPNRCAIAADSKARHCWCQQQIFSHAIIERAQKASQTRQCICQTCAQKAQQLAIDAS